MKWVAKYNKFILVFLLTVELATLVTANKTHKIAAILNREGNENIPTYTSLHLSTKYFYFKFHDNRYRRVSVIVK